MSYKNVKSNRQRNKQRIIYVMGGVCGICGYDKCQSAFDLHHIIPSEKETAISSCLNRSWDFFLNELPKCILVCANCHREIHEFNIQGLVSNFNKDKSNEITKQLEDIKSKKMYYCNNCGELVSFKSKICKKCSNINKRKVVRASREDLKNSIRNIPFLKIGEIYGVTDNTIRKWCKFYNLPSKSKDIKLISDKDWELI